MNNLFSYIENSYSINIFLSFLLLLISLFAISLKSKDRIFIIFFFIINSIGAIYYVFKGTLYVYPGQNSLTLLLMTLIIINISYIIFVLFFEDKIFKKEKSLLINFNDISYLSKFNFFILTSIIFLFFPFVYILINFKFFPIIQMLMGKAIGESYRPDVSGNIPHFYTFSVFLLSFTIPYLIFILSIIKNKFYKLIGFLILIFIALLPGNKSVLLEIFFFYFFIKNKNFNIKKILIFFTIFIGFYVLIKSLYYQKLVYDSLGVLFTSLFRRIFLIQPDSFAIYTEVFINNFFHVPDGMSIKKYLFSLIYHESNGGLSVMFPGSYLNIIGNNLSYYLFTFTLTILILLFRNYLFNKNYFIFKDSILYLSFYGAIELSNAYLSDFFLRSFLPTLFFLLLNTFYYNLFILNLKQKQKENYEFKFSSN